MSIADMDIEKPYTFVVTWLNRDGEVRKRGSRLFDLDGVANRAAMALGYPHGFAPPHSSAVPFAPEATTEEVPPPPPPTRRAPIEPPNGYVLVKDDPVMKWKTVRQSSSGVTLKIPARDLGTLHNKEDWDVYFYDAIHG